MPVTISGLASDIDTEGIINKLVEVEKLPLQRLQQEKQLKAQQVEAWKIFKEEVEKLSKITEDLYGFRSIFKEKKVIDNKYLTITPKRGAENSKHKIEVLSLANAHKLASDPIDENEKLAPSVFELSVGDEKRLIEGFKDGGTVEQLVEILNKEAGDIVDAQIIRTGKDKFVLSIESKKTGEKNKISIKGKSLADDKLFKNIGITTIAERDFLSLNFDDKTPDNFDFHSDGYKGTVSALIRAKKNYEYIPERKLKGTEKSIIKFIYNYLAKEPAEVVETDKGRIIKKNIGSVSIKDVTVHGADVVLNKLDEIKEEKEERFVQPVIELHSAEGEIQNITLDYTEQWKELSYSINLGTINKIVFKNSSEFTLLIDEFKIFSTEEEKEFKNVVQKPEDAKIKVDGVLVQRDRNDNLNDVIKDATVNLKQKTDAPLNIEIAEDAEKIKEKLNKFVEQYNRLIEFIAEAGKTSAGKKPGEYKKEDRGLLSNNITLMNFQSKLRSIVVDSYPSSLGNKLAILAQIGISTGKWGATWSDIRKGLLTIDENKLNLAIEEFGEKIGEIFGYDSNKDMIIDTGVAYKLVEVLNPYIAPKGLIDGQISLAELMIQNTEKRIAKKEEDIEKYKENLKIKFGKMESALQQYKGMSQALDNALGNLDFGTGEKKKESGKK